MKKETKMKKKQTILIPVKQELKIRYTVVPREFEQKFPVWDKPTKWEVKYV